MILWSSKRHDIMEKWQMEFSAKVKKVKSGYEVEIRVYDEVIMKEVKERYREALDVVKEEAKGIMDKCRDKNSEFLEYLKRIIESIEIGERGE